MNNRFNRHTSSLQVPMRLLALAFVVTATASAGAQLSSVPPASAPRVVADTATPGSYDVDFTSDSGELMGVGALTLVPEGKTFSGRVAVGMHSLLLTSVVRDGNKYVLHAVGNGRNVLYTLTFAKDSVSGSFDMVGGPSGKVRGQLKR